MSTRPDPADRLVAAILDRAAAAGCPCTLVAAERHDWASATFVGIRQSIALRAPATPALAAWLAVLPEAEFAIPRHLVADLAVDVGGPDVRLSTLLLRDR